MQLPIDSRLAEIVGQTERNTITLLQAEPGAGKTTRVPPALWKAGYAAVYVLEPRRLAARMAARRVAEEMGQPLGGTVGYQVRFEKVGDAQTKVWFLTEGVFTNRLLSGPPLPPRSIVVLDEFHERHLETDLALALLRKLTGMRPDLRLLIMSATLATNLTVHLPDAPLLQVTGRTFPVDVRHSSASAVPLEQQVAGALAAVTAASAGHILVFLPGSAEIRAAINVSRQIGSQTGARLLPLYGELNPAEQDLAVAPSSGRKIIFATNVAESSVTIDGVTTVIDSGLARIAAHSAWTGFSRLQIARISRASAVQRAGRAGRTSPGTAIRLFTQEDFIRRPEATPPEVVRTDWTETLLRLAATGYQPSDLLWLDAPPSNSLEAAYDLLLRLRALDGANRVTSFGRKLASLPVHPRLGCLALKGTEFGAASESAYLAAWLADGSARLDRRNGHRFSSDLEAILSAELSYTARRTHTILRDAARNATPTPVSQGLEKAILAAYPDRVAARRGETLLLANGASARMDPANAAANADFLVALDVDDRSEQSMPVVRLAIAIEPDWLLDLFSERIEAGEDLRWNRTAERVEQVSYLCYDRLLVDETVRAPANSIAATELLVNKALEGGLSPLSDGPALADLFARLRFAANHGLEIPGHDEMLRTAVHQVASGLTSLAELKVAAAGSLLAAVESQVDRRLLEEIAPTHVRLPGGRRAPIAYIEGQPPAASSRLQDFFGMLQTPTIARGAVPLTLKLLAPNGRPVQITKDLLSFWKDLYPQVRRELSRRYPRHSWPESPG